MRRLLMTGAAGGLGTLMRPRIAHLAESVRLSDLAPITDLAENEESRPCDLADAEAVMELVEGCDGIVHFGGISVEDRWEAIRDANIEGTRNIYEAARRHGRPRILYASSNHAIGFHPVTARLDAQAQTRPDSLYGVSKVFGEAMASFYHDQFGLETARVRIGSCFEAPKDHRMLATWLSPDDLARLIERVFRAPVLGCPVIYGVSDNEETWWDNGSVAYLGWRPRDSSEPFRAALDAAGPPHGPDDPEGRWQGGAFAAQPIPE